MKKNDVGLVVQIALFPFLIAFAILCFFEKESLPIVEALTAIFMFVMAYNNHITFKRKKWYTIAYIVAGMLIIGSIIF